MMVVGIDESAPYGNFNDRGNSERLGLLSPVKKKVVQKTPLRWFMLFLASSVAFVNGVQNLQFAGFAPEAIHFFQISDLLSDLLTQAYYISFVVFAFPVIWLIMKHGLRFAVICAASLVFVGETLTTISTVNGNFYAVALTSEFIAGVGQVFVFCLPSLLAGIWFPLNEVATASGAMVFFYELGNGLALLIPPLVVDHASIENRSSKGAPAVATFGSVAGFSFLILLFIWMFFADKPDFPANNAQASLRTPTTSYLQSLKNLFTNKNFILLLFSYAIDFGIFSAVESLYEAVILDNFPEVSVAVAGQILAFMIFVGTPAPLLFGFILDKTKKFILVLIIIHLICIASSLLLVYAIKVKSMWMVWVAMGMFGLGFTGKMSVGLETAAEMTYPEPEGTSSGILFWAASLVATIFIQIAGYLLTISNLYANLFVAACTIVSLVFTCSMKSDLRRTQANYTVLENAEGEE